MSHDPLMKAHACPIHSTWFQFVDHQVFNGRCYSTVERSLQGSNLVLPLTGCVTLGKLLTSLCLSKTEVAVVLTAAAAKLLQLGSDSLRPRGLEPSRLLRPWGFPVLEWGAIAFSGSTYYK